MIDSCLNTFLNNEANPGSGVYSLDNMKNLLNIFGNPHAELNFIHVAGTNGKGSVCMMIAGIFQAAGYKTGLYTSPHLLRINERIRINNMEITDNAFNRILHEVKKQVEKNSLNPTYFDILTIVSILYFAEEKTEIAVMETGLGGRLDSTNIINPLCSIITDISFDHEKILGPTLEKIAGEKCGIIKDKKPVITTNTSREILDVIKKRSSEMKSPLYIYGDHFNGMNVSRFQDGILFDYMDNSAQSHHIKNIKINHPGIFQAGNASAAVFSALMLNDRFNNINEQVIKDALSGIQFIGRFEIISRDPFIIFDPAHNPEAIKTLIKTIREKYKSYKIYAVLSLMADKNIEEITDLITLNFPGSAYFLISDIRAFKPDSRWIKERSLTVLNEKKDLFEYIACKMGDNTLFLFTGSFRLYTTVSEIPGKININE